MRVLIAEDDNALRDVLARALKESGYVADAVADEVPADATAADATAIAEEVAEGGPVAEEAPAGEEKAEG